MKLVKAWCIVVLCCLLQPLAALAQASIAGTWVFPGTSSVEFVFADDGTWAYRYFVNNSRGGMAGTYTRRGDAIRMRITQVSAAGQTVNYPATLESGYDGTVSLTTTGLLLVWSSMYQTENGQTTVTAIDPPSRFELTRSSNTGAPGQTGFTITTGVIPVENVTVNSSGTVSSLTLEVELKLAELFAPGGIFSAGGYQVYVLALTPAGSPLGAAFLQKPAAPRTWEAVQTLPLAAFMENVTVSSQDTRVRIEIIRDSNLSSLVGTEFYVGYGTSDVEMLQNRRFRGVYRVGQ